MFWSEEKKVDSKGLTVIIATVRVSHREFEMNRIHTLSKLSCLVLVDLSVMISAIQMCPNNGETRSI